MRFKLTVEHAMFDRVLPADTEIGDGTDWPYDGLPSSHMIGLDDEGAKAVEQYWKDKHAKAGGAYKPEVATPPELRLGPRDRIPGQGPEGPTGAQKVQAAMGAPEPGARVVTPAPAVATAQPPSHSPNPPPKDGPKPTIENSLPKP